MFGWRKKSEGFDWHAYVRTTIKLRREARRDRIDVARQAALDKAHGAGQAVAAGSKAASKAALAGAQVGAEHGAKGAAWFASNLGRAFAAAFGPLGAGIRDSAGRALPRLAGFDLAGPLALVGTVAAASGTYRWSTVRLDAEALVPLGIGAMLLLAAAPALLTRGGIALPRLGAKAWLAGLGGAAALAALFVGGRMLVDPDRGGAGLFGTATLPQAKSSSGEGRAQAITGDTLRLNGVVYRLAGIEAPERKQACIKPGNRRWRCGESALAALERMTRAKLITCAAAGSADTAGRTPATCKSDGRDVAADLVRDGHVFALSSLFGGYGPQEAEARERKAGLWNGDAERPSEYRAKAWETAKKASPDGCPIKGTVGTAGKTYVLPGAKDYAKAAIRAGKGERWFCSESDAAAAGFKPAERT